VYTKRTGSVREAGKVIPGLAWLDDDLAVCGAVSEQTSHSLTTAPVLVSGASTVVGTFVPWWESRG
jgi:hypothetical protein